MTQATCGQVALPAILLRIPLRDEGRAPLVEGLVLPGVVQLLAATFKLALESK